MQLIKKSALFALVLSSALICGQQVQAAKPSAAPAQETTLEVKAKLDAFAKSYVARANDTLKNNRQNMSVTKQGKGYVARYTEVDASTMTTEIYPGKGPGCEYVGHIVYLEKVYECTGKTIAELEAAIEGKTKEEMVDAVSSSTLVDTLGYVQGLLAAAKAANNQTGYYTLYNKTGETVKEVSITINATGEKFVMATDVPADAVKVIVFSMDGALEGHNALTFAFTTESGYEGSFATLSIETAPITMLSADAMTGATQISFFAPAAE